MSHTVDEYYSAYRETLRCAAKDHLCDACEETIALGGRYYSIGVVFDGKAESFKRCERCQRIHEHLRKLDPGEMWPAEKLDCGEEYREHWGKEPPEDIAALAFALPKDFSL